jgi:ribosomal protein S18 acetylase RimI-like enzyme
MQKEISNASSTVRLRPVEPDDEEFLFAVYASTRASEMELVPWDETQKQAFLRMQFNAQQEFYGSNFSGATHRIITLNDEPVGRLYVSRDDALISILDITILPAHRNAGIGSTIIKDILAEAAQTGKAVNIYVETFNPSLRLFESLGFEKIGEEDFNLLLEWKMRDKQEG